MSKSRSETNKMVIDMCHGTNISGEVEDEYEEEDFNFVEADLPEDIETLKKMIVEVKEEKVRLKKQISDKSKLIQIYLKGKKYQELIIEHQKFYIEAEKKWVEILDARLEAADLEIEYDGWYYNNKPKEES